MKGAGRWRPRLLSYVGRWGRARRLLPPEAYRVVDVGCASAYGTAALAGYGRPYRWVAGIERDAEHVREARRRYPWLPVVRADATALPLSEGSVDAMVLLDILEHLACPTVVLEEARGALRPSGCVVFSVPHRGLLAGLDPLNVYPALRRRWPSWPPLEPADESATGGHRHFTIRDAQAMLGPNFTVERTIRTGLGLYDVVHLALLVTFKGLLRWRGAYLALRLLHFFVYLVDDLIPAGAAGSQVMVRARADAGERSRQAAGRRIGASVPSVPSVPAARGGRGV